jgi:hypothetical protein
MITAQRVSRGFHRLAIFFAAIPLLIGVLFALGTPYNVATSELTSHEQVACAHRVYQNNPQLFWQTALAPGHETDPA